MIKVNYDPFYNKTRKLACDEIKVLTWNFSYGYGIGSAGVNYYQKSKPHFDNAIIKAQKLLKDQGPDIVFLQELDFKCKKSHYIDQLHSIGNELDYNLAYSNSWKIPYVPFPLLQLKDHFGATNAGAGILSKYPIISNKTIFLPKPKEVHRAVNYFYPFRYIQIVELEVGNDIITIGNVHLEAFKASARSLQSELIKELVVKYSIDFFAGDFNSPPYYSKTSSAIDDYHVDYNYQDDASRKLAQLKNYQDCIDKDDELKNEKKFFTFPTDKPDRRLDYIWFNNTKYKVKETQVLKNNVSDHFPLQSKLIKLNE